MTASPGAGADFWNGRTVLVTGGAGLVGSHLVDRVAALPVARVVVVDDLSRGRRENLTEALATGRVELREGDLRDRRTVTAAMEGTDLVFHQAAVRLTQCVEDPRLGFEVMVQGTFNVVEAAAQARIRKLVVASSASIYGHAETLPIDEHHHPYNDRTLYGAAKLFSEGLLRSAHDRDGLDYVALRYFNVYGPRMDIHGAYTEVLIRWMDRIAAGQPPVIFGDGAQTLDLVHVDDVVRANLLAAQSDATDAAFNIGSSTEVSLRELATRLLACMGSRLQPAHAPARTTFSPPRRWADIGKARRVLGFTPSVPLDDGLAGLVRWWRAETGR